MLNLGQITLFTKKKLAEEQAQPSDSALEEFLGFSDLGRLREPKVSNTASTLRHGTNINVSKHWH